MGSFGTETREAWCEGLRAAAPSASSADTDQTIEEVADINDTIAALCGEFQA